MTTESVLPWLLAVAGRERRMREVRRAVNRLSAAEREALALCVWAGVSYADAATDLNFLRLPAHRSVAARPDLGRVRNFQRVRGRR